MCRVFVVERIVWDRMKDSSAGHNDVDGNVNTPEDDNCWAAAISM